jgi:hypothetical protein
MPRPETKIDFHPLFYLALCAIYFHAGFLLGLFFDPEDVDGMFL